MTGGRCLARVMALGTRPFGSTGARFPEIGFSARAVGSQPPGDPDDPGHEGSLEAIQAARELGVAVFATADDEDHARSEEILGRALGGEGHVFARARVDIGRTGRSSLEVGDLREAVGRSLERLGRKQVSLLLLDDLPRPVLEDPATYAALSELEAAGLTRWTGLSVDHLEEALAVKDLGRADAVELPVSLLSQDTLDGVAELAEAGIAVVGREPLARGALTGWGRPQATSPAGGVRHRGPGDQERAMARGAQRAAGILREHGIEDPVAGALAFVLAHEVSVVLPGARTADQVRQAVLGAQEIGRLPSTCLQELYGLWDELEGTG